MGANDKLAATFHPAPAGRCDKADCTRTIPGHQCQNLNAPAWTLQRAALHFGLNIATVERYIREGLPAYSSPIGRIVKPREFIDAYTARRQKQAATRSPK